MLGFVNTVHGISLRVVDEKVAVLVAADYLFAVGGSVDFGHLSLERGVAIGKFALVAVGDFSDEFQTRQMIIVYLPRKRAQIQILISARNRRENRLGPLNRRNILPICIERQNRPMRPQNHYKPYHIRSHSIQEILLQIELFGRFQTIRRALPKLEAFVLHRNEPKFRLGSV